MLHSTFSSDIGKANLLNHLRGVSLSFVVMRTVLPLKHQFKVVGVIIQSIFIQVVNHFSGLKISAQFFLHYQAMLSNISHRISVRMFDCSDESVTATYMNSPLPSPALLSSHSHSLPSIPTFFRTHFSSSLTKLPSHDLEHLFAYLTLYSRIFHTPTSYHT